MNKLSVALPALLLALLSPSLRAESFLDIVRLDPAADAILPAGASVEKLADGFTWTEGTVWRKSGGCLLFSDIPRNTIYRWKEGAGISVFLRPAGYSLGTDPDWELGSNALTFDSRDRLVLCNHGLRRITCLNESVFTQVTLAEKYLGRRLNSPNDLVFKSNGDLYFTDPPYGLDGRNKDPKKELDFNGVFRLTPQGELTLLTRDLTFPNGIAFSPDEKTLYVAVSDPEHAVWMAYDVQPDGGIANGRVLLDVTDLIKGGAPGGPDGMKVDRQGNIFAAAPGGMMVISPQGKVLARLLAHQPADPKAPRLRIANCAWGDDGLTLYIAATSNILRLRTSIGGVIPGAP